jgi:hypothetical protein
MDGPDTVQPVVPRVRLSDQARRDAAETHTMQEFGGDEWIEDRRPGSSGQGQGPGQGQGQGAGALPQPHKSAPLQGGVTSSAENFGVKGNLDLQGLGEQAAAILRNERDYPKPPFPSPKMVSPALYKGWLQQTHPELKAVENKAAIVEIKGQWDDSAHVLHYFSLPATRINTNVVNKFDFSNSFVAIVDCAGDLNQNAIEILRSFVWNGGYLVSTDWSLDNFLVKAFPGAVEWNGGYSYPDLVDAFCVDFSTDYLKGCVPSARWKLDDKCQTVRVMSPGYVHVLARSRDLSRQDPDGFGILAVSFQYGKGQVLHVVGHFDMNSAGTFNNSLPDSAPRIGIGLRQAIIANFIVKGLEAHEGYAGKADGGKAASASGEPEDSKSKGRFRKKKNADDVKASDGKSADGKTADASGKPASAASAASPGNAANADANSLESNSADAKSSRLNSADSKSPEMQPPDMQLHDAEPPEALPIMER